MLKHRCTGLLLFLLLCLTSPRLLAQSPEEFLAEGNTRAAAEAFTARGSRADHFAAAEAWFSLDSLDQAVMAYQRTIAPAPEDSLAGLAQHKIGLLYYLTFQEDQAVAAYHQAIKIRDLAFSGAHKDRAHSRLNLAQTLIELGQNDTATVFLQEAIDLYARAQPTDSLNWMSAYNSLALLSEDARDYQVGVNAARQATTIIEELPAPDVLDVFDTWYAAGKTYLVFAELPLAETCARRALNAAEQSGYADVLVDALSLAAAVALKSEQYGTTLGLYEQILTLSKELGVPEADLGLVYFNLALAHSKLGKTTQALGYANKALPLLREDAYHHPRLYSIIGTIHQEAGDFVAARTAFNTGIGLLDGATGSALHYPTPEDREPSVLEILADLLGDRALALTAMGETTLALRDYRLLFDVQDKLRDRVTSDESRRYLSKNLRPFFDRAIALEFTDYAKKPDPETAWRAFALSERAKAYSLLTAIQQDRATMPKREAALRARIAHLERNATTGSPEAQRLAAARLELDRLLRLSAEGSNQAIAAFDRQRLQQFLQHQQTDLLAFHLGAGQGYRWLLRADGSLTFASLNDTDQLPTIITQWREAITQSAYRRKSLRSAAEQEALDANFQRAGLELYQQLLGTATLGDKVCLLPDGPLTVLPFGALPTSKAELPLAYDQLTYLQNTSAIHYAYSARVWLELAEKPALKYQRNLLAFAPTFSGESSPAILTRAIALREGERALTGLAPLAYNRPEVEEIVAMIPQSQAFYGPAADRQNFLEQLSGARIVHLSTHGVVNAAAPALSFVAFSQLGDSLEYEEMLYFNDLSALPIKAELAVLSACETSLGAYVPGETSLSLASAFTAAGARSTLTTLWQVDDAATKELIVAFYRELYAGKDRVSALMAAQQSHQQSSDFAHPFYWSALTLYGVAGPLPLDSGGMAGGFNTRLLLFAVLIFGGLLAGFWWLRRRATT